MFKKLLILFVMLLVSTNIWAQSITVIESEGWIESAYVTWQPDAGADSYNVYYSGEGITDQKIDDQLIRSYGTYYRADILGLKAGAYTIKIVPVVSDVEGTVVETGELTVEAHDRSGYAFWKGRVPGAYNADGTVKGGAVVLYITQNTKNTVALEVTGANANPCVGLQEILYGFKKGKDNRPLIVRLVGQVTDLSVMNKGDIVIENSNNASGFITFEGVGNDATADGWGIRVKNASNIEVRNIGLMNCDSDEGDDLGLQQDNDYIWVHHCDFFYGGPGGDSDQAKGDGALDSKRSGYVTFSYNHFWDTGKSNLLGNGTEDPEYLTYHHNWYDHSDSRHPRIRSHNVHVYNNFYDGNSKYGVGATNASSVLVEANYFRNCKYPILTSMQGSDVYDEDAKANDYSDMPTFSKEDGGSIKAFNNYMTGQRRFVPYGDSNYPNSTVDFDAYVASARDKDVPLTVKSYQGGNTHNNFDIDASKIYNYTPDSPEEAKINTIKYSGRMFGGDFTWEFNDAVDDQLYSVNAELKTKLTTYQTAMVAIQGDGDASGGDTGGGDTGGGDTGGGTTSGDIEHNFTLSGISSTVFSISGNLSDSKGTVSYAGLTLTQCLKIESSTSISFSTTKDGSLTLVFNDDFNGEIKINGTSHVVTNGILTIEIEAGSYEITKDDTANLYFMSIDIEDSAEPGDNTNNIEGAVLTDLMLYPNPVVNNLMIFSEAQVLRVDIYSITGMLMKSTEPLSNTIDVSQFRNGSYLVVVITNKGVHKQLIVKK